MALAAKMAKGAMGPMERTKKFLGLPGYDEATEMARKEVDDEIARLKKIEKSQGLTAREEKKLDTLMNRKAREESAETEGGMARERKGKTLTEKEKKQMQESLEFSKGGAVKKKKMMGGGMPKKYEKGGMATPLYKPNKEATYPDLFGSMGGKYTSPDNSTSSKTKGSNTNKEMYDVLPNTEEPKRKKPNPTAPSGKAKKPMMSFSKGGMANCGASMKPNGPKKGK